MTATAENSWHSRPADEIFSEFYSSPKGLTGANAAQRLAKNGPNELEEKEKKSLLRLFLAQFNSFIIWILIIATLVSYAIGERVDAVVIFIILILNAVFGFWQEFKAEKSIEALKRLAALKAKVIRDGKQIRIDARDIVPGDILVIESGDKVAADARLFEAVCLESDESSLTGESTPVIKDIKPVQKDAPPAERRCMVFSGTTVSKGRGRAVVVGTGMKTEIGKIAYLVQSTEQKETPLQHKLSQLGHFLGVVILVICAIIFLVGILRSNESIADSFMVAVSLAVAAIPEGLPAVVTICLALGVQRMVRKNALIRLLPAVETLGSCNVICTDKTGTLTYNQMTVREIFAGNRIIHVTGHGYVPVGEFQQNGKKISAAQLEQLLNVATLCNDAKLIKNNDRWEISGDPTEAALIVASGKAGISQEQLSRRLPRVEEIPFDSERKLMTTIHRGRSVFAYVKGAPDIIIEKCSRIFVGGKIKRLNTKDRKAILDKNEEMANRALRVLGFAYKQIKSPKEKNIESDLIFLGLMGMIDPPRQEVRESIKKCSDAGIKVVMITGDHKATAVAIGKELGIRQGKVLTGPELDRLGSLTSIVDDVSIYARVSPQHKMRIISALKSRRYVVAMTGDGVNDAPALKRADIGIAVGSGTDVAKEASDMVLTDDNFASIVNAVEEGRGIYDNIKKFVKYLLSSNLGEILTIFIAILVGYHDPATGKIILPLVAIQLLWINLLTDGAPALALGVEPTDPDVMMQKPRKSSENIISFSHLFELIAVGIIMAAGTLFVFNSSLNISGSARYASTMAFTTIVMFQLFNVLNFKSEKKSIFKVGLFSNIWLVIAILSSLLLQLIVIYTPLSVYLKTAALDWQSWGVIILVSSTVLMFGELKKLALHRSNGGT